MTSNASKFVSPRAPRVASSLVAFLLNILRDDLPDVPGDDYHNFRGVKKSSHPGSRGRPARPSFEPGPWRRAVQRYCAWRASTGTLRSRSEYFGEIFGKRFRLLLKTSAQLAEENRQKAEKVKERQEAARRKKAEEEERRARESADWEKNQSRILEYLESLSTEERLKVEITALTASPLGRGQISPRLRQSIIDQYVLDILEGRSE